MALVVSEAGFPAKVIPGGLLAEVVPLTFGRARIVVSRRGRFDLVEPGW